MFKVIVAGTRTFSDYNLLKDKLDNILKYKKEIKIISGRAKGADSLGEKYAIENNIPIEYFPADWKKYGKSAGPIRNEEMAQYADALVAFWDFKSKGTMNMINLAEKYNLQVRIIKIK